MKTVVQFITKNYFKTFVLASALLAIARILWVVFYEVDLFTEEAQYWLWTQNLDLSYYSKPPLVAYANYISAYLFGNNELSVRINAIISGFLLALVVFKFAEELFDSKKLAFFSGIILLVMPFYQYTSVFFTTDSLIILFWTITQYFQLKALKYNEGRYWVFTGVFLGMAILSKYTALAYYPVIGLYALLFKPDMLRNKYFYMSMLVSVLMLTPILYWLALNNWVSIKHVLALSGVVSADISFFTSIFKNLGEFIGGQMIVLSPFFLFPVLFSFKRIRNHPKVKKYNMQLQFLFVPVLIVWVLIGLIATKGIQVNWIIFSYGSIAILYAFVFVNVFSLKKLRMAVYLSVVVFVLFFHPKLFDKLGLSRVYPAKIDTFHRMYGWNELGDYTTKLLNSMEHKRVFIFSDNYHIASQVAFYTVGHPQTFCINNKRRMNQFDLWPGLEQFVGRGYDGLYITKRELPQHVLSAFDGVKFQDTYTVNYRGEEKTTFNIYYLSNYNLFVNPQPGTY